MDNKLKLVSGVGLGAGLLLLLDPVTGRRRFKEVRGRFAALAHTSEGAIGKTARDLRDRARDVVAEAGTLIRHERSGGDDALAARVRSKLARYVSHPSSIHVLVTSGLVTLSGPVPAEEVDDLIAVVCSVRGVEDVDDRLEVYEEASDMPPLSGEPGPMAETFELMPGPWSPARRLLLGAAGGGLALYGAARRGRLGAALGSVGLGLLVRGLTDVPVGRLTGAERERSLNETRRAIHVDAPIEEVFSVWTDYQNLPRMFSRVRQVRDLGEGRSRWAIEGPAGASLECDAVLTRFEPGREVAWRTVREASVSDRAEVRFSPDAEGGTRVEMRLFYRPQAGAAGEAITLFGAGADGLLDDDLLRMKTLIETGRTPHDTAER
jgi:uncharacterized membrane protein